ncbi:hypothetical protein ACWD5Q_19870 [Streptomyces sp. NPDC002513]
MDRARQNQKDADTAIQNTSSTSGTFALPDPEEADYAFNRSVAIFTAAASAHLNGDNALAAEAQASAATQVTSRPA